MGERADFLCRHQQAWTLLHPAGPWSARCRAGATGTSHA